MSQISPVKSEFRSVEYTPIGGIYRNNLKNREFDKEVAQILESGASDIVREQGASEDPKFVAKPTSSKTDCSSCFGIVALLNDRYESSLRCAPKNRSIISWFGQIWSTIRNFLSHIPILRSCFRNENEIDWADTKQVFTGIKQAVFPESGADAKSCKFRFKTHYEELTKAAQELFQRHIGYAIARQNRASDRAQQEKYVDEHWTEISQCLKDVMDDISRDEIREAVTSFETELNKH